MSPLRAETQPQITEKRVGLFVSCLFHNNSEILVAMATAVFTGGFAGCL